VLGGQQSFVPVARFLGRANGAAIPRLDVQLDAGDDPGELGDRLQRVGREIAPPSLG